MAVVSGGGNGSGYSIHDITTDNISTANGEWDTGAYPVGSAFSPLGTTFAASNGDDLMVFDAITHVEISATRINQSTCDLGYDSVTNVQYSTDGQTVLILAECGINKSLSVLHTIPAE